MKDRQFMFLLAAICVAPHLPPTAAIVLGMVGVAAGLVLALLGS